MIKRLAGCVREYKKPTILTLIFIVGEAFIETFIPFITAKLVNLIKYNAPMEQVVRIGLFLVLMACLSLCCGGIAGATCAKASTGFARNLRHDMFERVQSFSFENIDRFSSASLVTRMTTDVSNVQMSFMMIIRMAIRCPLMFIFCIVMAFIMGGKLALTFVVVVPVLIFGLLMIARKAMPAFRAVFRKYDRLNESIEENVRAMRVVKGFAREDYEKQKFGAASEDICGDFTHAERIVARTTGERYYIATMRPCSEENLQRIEKHREQRKDLQFTTLECPYQVGAAAVERDGVVLLEDVSNLLANAMFERGGDEASVYADIEALCSRCRLLVAVTITGLRADGYDGETAAYIRALNGLNQRLYDRAAAAVAMKDGAPFAEKGDLDEII